MQTATRTETDTIAGIIRSAAAWWQLAADALDAGDLEQAAQRAHLGQLGTDGMHTRIARLALEAE